ncbi:MAG: hypothetical protein H0V15_05735, partial [Solirubrobacterales bacterium]|nr:hypothetical protein [Solirubrobacterales bacterium]
MTGSQYFVGVFAIVLVAGSLGVCGFQARRALLPQWSGPLARLAEVIIALAVMVVVAEALGTVGLLQAVPLGVVILLATVAVWAAGRRRDPDEITRHPEVRWRSPAVALSVFAAVAACGAWAGFVRPALRSGMSDWDTLWYHMPFAARFAQTGSVTPLHYVGNQADAFIPANAELVHTLGILLFGNDGLSPLINVGWLALALLAAACIGRTAGCAAASASGVAVVLALPVMASSQAGTAKNDAAGLALLLAAMAFLVEGRGSRHAFSLSGIAAGLALGTKVTLLAPALAVGVGAVVMAPPRRRFALAGAWGAGACATGAFWYLRNVFRAGNPLPWFPIGIGPLQLPATTTPTSDCGNTTLAHYATDFQVLHQRMLPQLEVFYSQRWWMPVGLALVGIVAGLASKAGSARLVAAVGFVALAAYVVTPATAGGPEGNPLCFGYNTRFAAAGVAAGAVALVLALAARWPRSGATVAAFAIAATLVATWSTGQARLAAAALVAGLVVLAAIAIQRSAIHPAVPGLGLVLAVAVAVGWPVQKHYLSHRYRDRPLREATDAA